jgi:hypothetical protein
VAAEAGLSLGVAGDYLLSQEGQARVAELAPLEPGWLPLLRRLRAELPGPTSREPFVTKMAELIGVWHDLCAQRQGRVTFDTELAVELGLLGDGDDQASAAMRKTEEGWAAGVCLTSDKLTPQRPRTIEFMPQGIASPCNDPPWNVRLGWITSPGADIERTECFDGSQISAWGFLSAVSR